MPKRALVPPGFREAAERLKMSPGILSAGHVFLTGVTGSEADGTMPPDLTIQFRNAFAKIDLVLREAGPGFEALVEMTSYHVGLGTHFELFDAIRLETLCAPYPAWTAVEVAGLRREGAAVEIKAIACVE